MVYGIFIRYTSMYGIIYALRSGGNGIIGCNICKKTVSGAVYTEWQKIIPEVEFGTGGKTIGSAYTSDRIYLQYE